MSPRCCCHQARSAALRAIYKIADHFLLFWFRFVAALRSQLELQDVEQVYQARVQPYLDDYMGRRMQYLKRNASRRYALQICGAGRYWSRDGAVEIDIVGDLEDDEMLVVH